MLTEWWPHLPAFAVLVIVLWAPGLALLWSFGERRGTLLLSAPAFSTAVVGVSGVALDLLGMEFRLLSQALAALVLCLPVWLVGRLIPHADREHSPRVSSTDRAAHERATAPERDFCTRYPWMYPLAAATGLAVASALLLRRMVSVIGVPEALAQRWDNVFHLNAIRWIAETGSGSTLTLNRMLEPDRDIAVYPAAWHQLASLVVPLTGDSVLVAQNLTLLVVAGVVWPASCIFLTRVLVGPSPVAAVAAGIASAGFALFPLGLMSFGPLFPNILALAVLPVPLGILVRLLGPELAADPTFRSVGTRGRARLAACLVVTVGALLVSQPNGLLAMLVMLVPLLLTSWGLSMRRALDHRRRFRTVVLVGAAAGAVLVWLLLWNTLTTEFYWAPFTTTARAVGEALLYATNGRQEVPWVLVVLTVLGIYAALSRRRLRWLVVGHLLLVSLYAVAAAGQGDAWRQWLTGGWYTDSHRLAATLPLTAVPLIALGASHAVAALVSLGSTAATFADRPRGTSAVMYPVAAVLLLAVAAPLSQAASMTRSTQAAKSAYAWEGVGNVLSREELALLDDLDTLTEPDDIIAVNPWNGGALAWAVAERPVTQYHIVAPEPPLDLVVARIDTAAADSEVCAAALQLDIGYVLDFGEEFVIPDEPRARKYAGVNAVDPEVDTNLSLVRRSGDAALYEVVGCEAK